MDLSSARSVVNEDWKRQANAGDWWLNCDHQWFEPMDSETGKEVTCRICSVPGEYDVVLGEVYWPAT